MKKGRLIAAIIVFAAALSAIAGLIVLRIKMIDKNLSKENLDTPFFDDNGKKNGK